MSTEIITIDDLRRFRLQLLEDLKGLMESSKQNDPAAVEGLKTKHVRKMLDCSINKLQAIRVSGKLRTKKIGGTVYYNKHDVKKLLDEGY